MTPQNRPEANPNSVTFCEKYAVTPWGRYLAGVEKQAILHAHSLFARPGVAFEVGCEGGRWSKLLADAGWALVCTDVDQASLEICQSRLPSAKCLLANPEDTTLPAESQSVDLVLCIEVFPVIEGDWFFPESHRILKQDGIVLGVVLNRHSLRGMFAHHITEPKKKAAFKHYQNSYADWRKKLARVGFGLVYEKGFCWAPFSRMSRSAFVPWFTACERWLRLDKLPRHSPWIIFAAKKVQRS